MNQGRIWTVVKPTVGLPLFLGAVAATSLIVHYAILTHTTWFPAYWQGGQKKVSQQTPDKASPAAATFALAGETTSLPATLAGATISFESVAPGAPADGASAVNRRTPS